MYLFFDTETTGLPGNWRAPVTDLGNWPRLVQIAWLQYDGNGSKISGQAYILRPDGFTIPDDAAAVHGITNERAAREGVALQGVLREIAGLIDSARLLIAHNMSFDEKVLGAEFIRYGIRNALDGAEKVCTMREATEYCGIPGPYGFKWPKLSELYRKLFNTEIREAHDAAVDIAACAECFWELVRRGVIDPPVSG